MRDKICIFTVALLFWTTSFISADTVWLAGQSDPIFGIIESVDDNSLRIRQTEDGTTFEQKTLPRYSVVEYVQSYQPQRLAELTPRDWKPWNEYAEELFSQKRDPVARNLAIRLLIVVAANTDNVRQRNAALADLIALGRDSKERESFELLRYLKTGIGETDVSQTPKPILPAQENRMAAADFVRAIRQGQTSSDREDNQKLHSTIDAFDDICSWQELISISSLNRIDNLNLLKLIDLEVALRSADPATKLDTEDQWHQMAQRIGTSQLSLPSFKTVTEFDPTATRYIDGQWTSK